MPFKDPQDRRRYDRERKRLLRAQQDTRPVLSIPVLQLSTCRGTDGFPDKLKADNEPQTGPSAGRAECRKRFRA